MITDEDVAHHSEEEDLHQETEQEIKKLEIESKRQEKLELTRRKRLEAQMHQTKKQRTLINERLESSPDKRVFSEEKHTK